jgi:nicotinate-nucleotide pyrophosphorylase (carboxylating)
MPKKIRIPNACLSVFLKEDIGSGDHTTNAIFINHHKSRMHLRIKDQGVIAGLSAAAQVYKRINTNIRFKPLVKDGQMVTAGMIAFEVYGSTKDLLKAERLVLNIMQRMSGIATATRMYCNIIQHTSAQILDTRKTTPGFRLFEKWAVAIGGGQNHRFGLYDMILIKDNHIDAAGTLEAALEQTFKYLKQKQLKLPVVVEARTLHDVAQILKLKRVNRILLDNFNISQLKKAVQLAKGKVPLEASGGINFKTIKAIAETGVDYISIGALTHHIKSLDLSLKVF